MIIFVDIFILAFLLDHLIAGNLFLLKHILQDMAFQTMKLLKKNMIFIMLQKKMS